MITTIYALIVVIVLIAALFCATETALYKADETIEALLKENNELRVKIGELMTKETPGWACGGMGTMEKGKVRVDLWRDGNGGEW